MLPPGKVRFFYSMPKANEPVYALDIPVETVHPCILVKHQKFQNNNFYRH